MRPLSYRQLLNALKELTDEQLNMSVSVLDDQDEVIPVFDTMLSSEVDADLDGIVEENQPLLILEDIQ